MGAMPEHDLACCRLPQTDLGNAERWRIRFGGDFRFCPEFGWFAWDSRRWKLLSEEKDQVPAEVIWSITLTVRAIRNEAALVAALGGIETFDVTDKAYPALAAWAMRAQSEGRERYLRALRQSEAFEDDDSAAAWLDRQGEDEFAPRDSVVDFGKRKAWSTTLAAWAKTSEGAAMINRIVRWAKGFADIVCRPEDFDADRMAINVLNGTLRLERKPEKRASSEVEAGKSQWRTGDWRIRLHPHRREDMNTKLAPVKYSPRAHCPAYDGFITQVQPDEAMRRFIHQWGGLSLTGDIGEHKLAFFHGGGRNGKGTWVELVAHIMGDYAGSVGIESLAESGGKRRGDQATPDIARLPGVRFLRVSEPEKGMSFNDGLIKQLTGGDPVDARHLNKGFFTFLPSFKLTISGNNKPRVKDISHGMWARMQLVPWDVTIPEDEIDRTLGARMKAEASGVLNRLLAGLIDWRRSGLIVPDAVRDATREYREDSDQLGRFLSALCEVGDDPLKVRVGATELWEIFQAWVDATGAAEWKRAGFVNAMKDKGFAQKTSNGTWWLKLRLKPGVTVEKVKSGEWASSDAGSPIQVAGEDYGADEGPVPGWD